MTEYEIDEAVLDLPQENINLDEITFERDEDASDPDRVHHLKVTQYEFEMTLEGERSFDNREEYIQHMINLGYTVVRDGDGELIGLADGIEVDTE